MVERRPTVANKAARPAGPRPVAAEATLTPKEVFGVLRRHILLIVGLTLLGVVAGGASWFAFRRFLPKYTASTFIEVLPPVQTDPMDIVATQVQKDIQYEYRVSMANLIKQQSSLQDLLRNDKVRETEWFKRRDRDVRKAFKDLEEDLGAYALRDARFVQVAMSCPDPKEAALIVNEMVQLFVSSQGGTKRDEISQRLSALQERQGRVQQELAAANDALDEVRERFGIIDLEQPRGRYFKHTISLKLDDLELQKNNLLLAIRQTQADIQNLKELATGPITVQVEYAIERDPVMVTLAQQLAFQEAQLSGRLSKFGENHRDVRQTKQLIEEIRQERQNRKEEIAEQTRKASYENAMDRLIVLQERLAQLNVLAEEVSAKKKDLDMARVQYEQRLKIRDERVEMLDEIKMQIEKFRIILNDPETVKVRLVGLAPEPLHMSASRQWWLWLPGGTLLGFLFGIGLAFLVEMLNDLVRTPTDVARYLHIPLLGIIPDASEDKQVRKVDLYHAVRQAPYSIISESYRRFRTNLELSGLAKSLKTVLIAGGDAGDGRTSVAANLAGALVAQDKKVLLIDANFRQPSLHKIFPRTQSEDKEVGKFEFGLSSVLTNQCDCKDPVRPTGLAGLDVIDAGPLPSNPSELLASSRMEELLKEHRKKYDHIVIDSPPVLLVSDAKVLAKFVDATILVFNAAVTRRGAARRTISELRDVEGNVVGCVLFGARAMKGGYFHERFKSYQEYLKPQMAGASPA